MFKTIINFQTIGIQSFIISFILIIPFIIQAQGHWDPSQLPSYLHDRGIGNPISMTGTYARQGEWDSITEIQYRAADWMMFKINNAFVLIFKASGWAPDIGIMFSLNGE